MRLVWLALCVVFLAGCGSGGGGAAGSSVQPATALLDISTQAASSAAVLYSVEFTLHLPAAVTLPADPASGEVPAGVLQPFDARAFAGARYQPAAAGARASLRINIVDPLGFGGGALATLNCSVASGTAVSAQGFSTDDFAAKDANGAIISGVVPHFTIRMQ